ncbi:MAG: helix-turn-helix domain-containing protein [Smithellaceae bacterium]|nr:helix-turn-helix domain-containing protein [Smithellaceae bacterium]
MITYERLQPRASLSELFDLIEIYEVPKEDTPLRLRFLPEERRYLSFCCGSAFYYEILGIRTYFREQFFFSGVSPNYAKISLDGALTMINFRLSPCSIFRFTDKDASLYANKLIAFDKLLDIDSSTLIEHLIKTGDVKERVGHIQDFIEQLPLKKPSICDEKFSSIIRDILNEKGQFNVQHIIEKHAVSYTYMERLFHHYIGISPKKYSSLLRIKHIIELSKEKPSIRYIDLALEQGYYDQAHFNKEFKQFTGINPHTFYRTKKLLGDSFVLLD